MLFPLIFLVLSLMAFLPRIPVKHWFFRGFDFIRPQLLFLQFLALGCWLGTGAEQDPWILWSLGAMIGSIAYQLAHVFPYTALNKASSQSCEKQSGESLRILIANVLQPNPNKDTFVQLVEQTKPDLLLMMESDQAWETAVESLAGRFPHAIRVPLDNLYGMHLYSAWPLQESRVRFLVEEDVPSIETLVQLPSGNHIQIFGVHPAPPSPTENETSTERDAELMRIGQMVRDSIHPCLVCGDLNDVAWSRTTRLFRKLSGLQDPRMGRGFYSSFHTRFFFLRFPMDHLFHTEDFCLRQIRRLPNFGSDHFAMCYELGYRAKSTAPSPSLSTAEKEEVESHLEAEEEG
jgi:endonuclease/exonuclease/phosphatase (EEP) superfamily protein YafD